ncbi:hypothetical protein BGW80DRAFT_1367676 [Lactifluus volemus]|nr:hypothetical protein BGW80DRAFT_1367676 [Lactifluus volemus]
MVWKSFIFLWQLRRCQRCCTFPCSYSFPAFLFSCSTSITPRSVSFLGGLGFLEGYMDASRCCQSSVMTPLTMRLSLSQPGSFLMLWDTKSSAFSPSSHIPLIILPPQPINAFM